MMKRYKVLRFINGVIRSENGDVTWHIGEWQHIDEQPILCERGFHCSERVFDAFSAISGEVIARVEVAGTCDKGGNKEAWQAMRLLEAWHWKKEDSVAMAIYAAEPMIDLYEKHYPEDNRPRKAIEMAKAWLENPSDASADATKSAAQSADAAAYTRTTDPNIAIIAAAARATARAAYAACAATKAASYAAAYATYAADAVVYAAYAEADIDVSSYEDVYDGVIEKVNTWMEAHLETLDRLTD